MEMTNEQYEQLVSRLEETARRDPGGYRRRVALLALLGYAYLLSVVVILLALAFFVGWLMWESGKVNALVIKVGWIPLALAVFVLRALWVRIPPPEGHELTRETAPELFATVDEITRVLDSPRIDRVLIDGEYNASVVQLPRLGPLGWFRNYLSLGLPLMQALTPEQFRAVLAHELGHLSGKHGRFTGWIYRVRRTWLQLLERFQREQRYGAFLFERFFNWYAPYFHAYSFVLARKHEYEADEAAARIAGSGVIAEALIAMRAKADHISEHYWPGVFKEADTQPRPVSGAFANLSQVLRGPVPEESATDFVRRALHEKTGHSDTHPSLADRLAALNYPPQSASSASPDWVENLSFEPLAETAAQRFLGADAEARLAAQFDEVWQRGISDSWRQRHRYVVESRERMAELAEKARTSELTPNERYKLGELTAEFGEAEDAIPLLRSVPKPNPNYASANFLLGQLLLQRDDDSGMAHIEEALERDKEFAVHGYAILYSYLLRMGRPAEAQRYKARLEEHGITIVESHS
ncbi:MAG TPA: M48 family metallopeptidase [Pyrinomonadaceae bacterium]|nr:M48 family metallopeptidase [Pyrinomonadaceae bacterium]